MQLWQEERLQRKDVRTSHNTQRQHVYGVLTGRKTKIQRNRPQTLQTRRGNNCYTSFTGRHKARNARTKQGDGVSRRAHKQIRVVTLACNVNNGCR